MGLAKVTSRLLVTAHRAPSNSRIMDFRKHKSFINVKFAEGQRGRHGSAILAMGKRPVSRLGYVREKRSEKGRKYKEGET